MSYALRRLRWRLETGDRPIATGLRAELIQACREELAFLESLEEEV